MLGVAVVKTIQEAQPLPRIPPDPSDDLDITIAVAFDLDP
ncbi:TonB-like protein (fragment) [Bradyrhizobium sp. STM 3843]